MTVKARLQADISSGEITTRQKLLERAASLSLKVTRNGRDYVGLLGPDGKRFRIRFVFLGDMQTKSPKGPVGMRVRPGIRSRPHWIYALTAHSRDGKRKACYIGQTVNLKRRFREHLRRRRLGYASSALFDWAVREQVEVRATVLTLVEGDQSYASHFEGYWLKLAIEAGFAAPGSHNWGRLPLSSDPIGQPSYWPATEIFASSLPLSELVEHGLTPFAMFVVSRESFS